MSILKQIDEAGKPQSGEAGYQVTLPAFYGPMDLLLDLIEREELEITEISLAQITDQYLSYVNRLKEITPDTLTDFLAVASRLLLLKSQVLLPSPPTSIAEEERGETDDLVQQLLDYKRFKELAQTLHQLEAQGERNFIRVAGPTVVEPKLQAGGGNVTHLLAAVRRALAVKPEEPEVDQVVSRQEISIGDRINTIRHQFSSRDQVAFSELLTEAGNRVEVIVTLLAVLELLKHRFINAEQPDKFGHITLTKLTHQTLSTDDWLALESMTELS